MGRNRSLLKMNLGFLLSLSNGNPNGQKNKPILKIGKKIKKDSNFPGIIAGCKNKGTITWVNQ